jgi:LysM repeat protein/uncharacterized protein YvpB
MTKMLDVPYRSQWDDDANKSTADCGPACLAMILGFFGEQISINELFTATGVEPGRYVGFGQLQRVARNYGITFRYGANHELNDLKRWVDEGKPAIALIKYSHWSQIEPGISTQDTFTGPHFVVVVGYGDGNVYVNDPNYWPPRREEGHNKAWSEVLFNLAWSNVRTTSFPNPNNSVIVPAVGKSEAEDFVTDTEDTRDVIEYTVQPGDTWSGLAAKFYGDQTRYPEILAFNGLNAGAGLFVGQKLRISVTEGGEVLPPAQPIVLGEGAEQIVDADLVNDLREKWVSEGKVATSADDTAVLRVFVDELARWEGSEADSIEYIVQPGDTWAGIAGDFLGDQMRYPEIIMFNQLPPNAPLNVGQKIRIPLG